MGPAKATFFQSHETSPLPPRCYPTGITVASSFLYVPMFTTVVGDSCKLLSIGVVGVYTGNVASIGVSAYVCVFTYVNLHLYTGA